MFNSARLKLTFWYLLIIMLVSAAFSAVIYKVLTNELDRLSRAQRVRFERALRQGDSWHIPGSEFVMSTLPPVVDPELVTETKQRVIFALLIVDGSIFILSGGLAYFLAGRTLNPIKKMLDEQNRFITDSSHELRTPLTSLKTAMEVSLRDKNMKLSEARSVLAESIEEVDKLQRLSDDLLRLAQYQKPSSQTVWENVRLIDVTRQAVKTVTPLAKQKKIKIVLQVADVSLQSNRYRLNDLLVILLENAVKYSPDQSTITVIGRRRDGKVKISVADQGKGINRVDLPHIFDRFFRANTSRTNSAEFGYGLGLSIAQKIVESFHGSLSVKSQENQGSTFSVSLPARQPTS